MEKKSEILDCVLTYPKIREALDKKTIALDDIKKNIQEIHGEAKENWLEFSESLLDHTIAKLYDSIPCELPYEGFNLSDLSQKYNLILVPNHQSHGDYIALSYIFFKKFKVALSIAGGINLNIFLLGTFFRNTGAFFIRRSFQNDISYKLSFEGYLYYLLAHGKIVEFFFEGGRSRTGKLLPPKFGLFQMILEAHSYLPDSIRKPLRFIPVSIAHEQLPEETAHARELSGAKKERESFFQLAKIIKIFGKKFGSLHIRIGHPIEAMDLEDQKLRTQELAFECFRKVGEGIPITPVALLALVLLDDPSGSLTLESIYEKSESIISYCVKFMIPLGAGLGPHDYKGTIKNALDLMVLNQKLELINHIKLKRAFYTIRPEARVKVVYFKNMVLHHFLIPSIMTSAWYLIVNGTIKNLPELSRFLMEKRRELRFEFYLPSIKQMLGLALSIVAYTIGRELSSLEEVFTLNKEELFQIGQKIKPFSNAITYIYETYYLAVLAYRFFGDQYFTQEEFLSVSKEIHELELSHGRIIKYRESYLVPILKDCVNFFIHTQLIAKSNDKYHVINPQNLDYYLAKFSADANDRVGVNLKVKGI
ncbi:MAG: 1-acyl-sn-glycerol-3-phosphate acyltransferase [Bacteriovoracaceae bacterium]|nr:1-acyl-sn-glycerol-3-phosphate acyltransferase [Bacteriovoracaceae bacterium]